MNIVSWNLNGLLSKVKNHQFDPLIPLQPDVICLQEIRTKQRPVVLEGYHHIWNPAARDGFWGTLMLTRTEPLDVVTQLGIEIDDEGRLIAAEFERLWVVNVYTPNSQKKLRNRERRLEWDQALNEFVGDLAFDKPVVVCGDFNVAIHDEDIYEGNRHQGEESFGYLSEERTQLTELLEAGFVDGFRYLYPDVKDAFTWWSNRRDRRSVNHGWRLDYFIVSEDVAYAIKEVRHLVDIPGSDHCPIEMVIAL